MKKVLSLTTFVILVLFASAKIQKVTIEGTVKGLGNCRVVLLNTDRTEITNTEAKNDRFIMTANVETGDMRYYILHVPSLGGLGPSMSIPFIMFFICSDKVTIEAGIDSKRMSLNSIKGSPCQDDYERIMKSLPATKNQKEIFEEANSTFHQYNEVEKSAENLAKLNAASKRVDMYYDNLRQQIRELIPTHRKSMAMAVIASQYLPSDSVEELEALWDAFDSSVRNNYYLQKMKEKIDGLKAIAIGKVAPDFEIKDKNGNSFKISSFRGKFVLLDFWASWCGPCRKENPNVLKALNTYKNKGFEVLAVAVYDTRDKWLKAVEEDKTPFVHVMDIVNNSESVASLYQIKAIPANFLLDPTGKIVAQNLRGIDLCKKLAEIFK